MRNPSALTWRHILIATLLAADLYAFSEWLFIVTKPSFMDTLGAARKVEIALFAAAVLAIGGLLSLIPLWVFSRLPRLTRRSQIWERVGLLIPALMLGALALMLTDNFTYTVLKFGIVTSQGIGRGVYALILVGLTAYIYRELINMLRGLAASEVSLPIQRWLTAILISLLLVGGGILLANGRLGSLVNALSSESGAFNSRPHILLITIDGVDADHMSLYGYARDTTPRLRALAPTALVAENAYPNGNVTAISIVSLYTGKYPSQSRFFYPPNILRDATAYQHLPGILRTLGYQTLQIAVPHYVDAVDFNMLDSFDISNGTTLVTSNVVTTLNRYLANDFAYFLYEVGNRLADRMRHILYIKSMSRPLDSVTNPKYFNDAQKITQVLDVLTTADQPVFIHAHLMGTHGDKFFPSKQVFSAGIAVETQEPWNLDLYDDAILDFDTRMGYLVDELSAGGLMDKTIIVIGADHGLKWTETHRLPLIFLFPDGRSAGTIQTSVQNMDIAPTLLAYLGLQQPAWMSGLPLLDLNPPRRPIISNGPSKSVRGEEGWVLDLSVIRPPFYDLGKVNVIWCDSWYSLDLYSREWKSGEIKTSTDHCQAGEAIAAEDVLQLMIDHLRLNGYDTSSIEDLPVK